MEAAVSGRTVALQSVPGLLLLVFHSYQTARAVGDVITAVRDTYPSPNQVLVAGVADMRPVPRLLRGAASAIIKSAYQEAQTYVPPGHDPADHIIILPDWEGDLYRAYRAPRTDRQLALVLVDEAKRIAGTYYGPRPVASALSLSEAALAAALNDDGDQP